MSSWKRWGSALASSWILATLPGLARAADLVARGPEDCPDARELAFRIERKLTMPLEQAAPLRFDVTMEHSLSGHRARIDVTPGGLHRELAASDCEKLAEAVSIAVALALGNAAAAASASSTSAAAAASSAAGPAIGAASARERAPQRAEPDSSAAAGAAAAHEKEDRGRDASLEQSTPVPKPSLSLWLLADAGSLPAPAVGASLGAEAAWRRFELHVLATLFLEQETQVESSDLTRPGARLQLWTGSALGCTLPWGERTALTPVVCVGLEVGQLSGVGTGVSEPRRGSALWAAPLVQLGWAWAIPDSSLRLEVALLGALPLNRDEFTLRGVGTVHQPNAGIGRLSVGVGFDL
jgi:hypothetical protein